MRWTRQKLASYLSDVRMTIEFEGITGEELARAVEGEAMQRLKQIRGIVYNEYQNDEEKVSEIIGLLED